MTNDQFLELRSLIQANGQRLDKVESGIEVVGRRLDKVESGIQVVGRRLDKVESLLDTAAEGIHGNHRAIERIARMYSERHSSVDGHLSSIDRRLDRIERDTAEFGTEWRDSHRDHEERLRTIEDSL